MELLGECSTIQASSPEHVLSIFTVMMLPSLDSHGDETVYADGDKGQLRMADSSSLDNIESVALL